MFWRTVDPQDPAPALSSPLAPPPGWTIGRLRLLRWLGPSLSLVLFVVAILVLRHFLADHKAAEIWSTMHSLPAGRVLLALLLTAGSYAALSLYDVLGLQFAQHHLGYPQTLLTSFISYAFSHNLGLTLLSSASTRFRLYSGFGVPATRIARVVVYCNLAFWAGFFACGGVVLSLLPLPVPEVAVLPFADTRPVGLVCLGLSATMTLWILSGWRPALRGHRLPLPTGRIYFSQLVVCAVDWLLAASVLWAVLPGDLSLGYSWVLAAFFLAQVIAMASSVPGGLGIFETILLFLVGPEADPARLLGSLLVFRAIYFLLPLGVAIALLSHHEIRRPGHRARRAASRREGPSAPRSGNR